MHREQRRAIGQACLDSADHVVCRGAVDVDRYELCAAPDVRGYTWSNNPAGRECAR